MIEGHGKPSDVFPKLRTVLADKTCQGIAQLMREVDPVKRIVGILSSSRKRETKYCE